MDGDGRWEIATQFGAERGTRQFLFASSRWAIVRLDGNRAELLAVAWVNDRRFNRESTIIDPMWQDEDGDGMRELSLLGVTAAPGQGGRPSLQHKVLASLDWTGVGGVMVPAHLPDDGSIRVWTPPDGRPIRFSADEDIEPLLDRVFPVPGRILAPSTTSQQSAAESP
jgi:hypothetical protein